MPQEVLEQIRAFNKEEQEENYWKNTTDEPNETDINESLPNILIQNNNTHSSTKELLPQIETLLHSENYAIQTDSEIGIASGKTKYNLNVTAIKLDLSQNLRIKNIHVVYSTNQGHYKPISFTFISVSIRKNIEPFNPTIDIFYNNMLFR